MSASGLYLFVSWQGPIIKIDLKLVIIYRNIFPMDQPQSNPLARYFRQPSLYLKLPSQGKYWPQNALTLPLNNEIPVLPMSIRDEILLKTPDALLNGQGVVDVIQSCCPNIIDAWQTPSIDVDAIIIALRIASYGNAMDVTADCPHRNTNGEYSINLLSVLEAIEAPSFNEPVEIKDLRIKLKPQAYFNANKVNMIQFEEQQLARTLVDLANNPDQSNDSFTAHLTKLFELNALVLAGSTDYILLESGERVADADFISEFYQNCDPAITRGVKAKIDELSIQGGIKPVDVECDNCTKHFNLELTFDFSSFFAKGS